jgi:hypothetical protein
MAHVSDIFSASTGKAIESAIVAQKKSWWPLVGQLWRVLGAVFIYRRVSNSSKNLPSPPPPPFNQPLHYIHTYNLLFLCVCKLFWFLEFYSTPFFFRVKLPPLENLERLTISINTIRNDFTNVFHISDGLFYSIFVQCSGSLSFDCRPPPHTGGELARRGVHTPL